ncbi:unnamed protein product [Larinioides sclopetarius]|uniref:Uncharacterized protein n=1 Tax=Larinioides sclopetarius TaxID=280406 RepID=A0AAV2BVG1_9ARAC
MITSDSVTVSYSYEKNDDGMPIRWNEAYKKLKSGDLLLSPYTFWEVKLINKTNKTSFLDLDKYKNEISVELSGLGSYVLINAMGFSEYNSFTFENNTIENNTMASSVGGGLRDCKRSKYRSTRSVNGIAIDGDFMTNNASKGISSPIAFLYHFLKTYIVSNLVISINHAFFGEKVSVRSDCSKLPDECTYPRKIGPTVMTIPTITDTDSASAKNDCIKKRIGQKTDTIFDVHFHENNSCLKSFLLSDQKYGSNNHSTQIPDLNCSLLLADLVTRTITHNKYISPIDESLLSPREVMLSRIVDGVVRDESEVKRMLHRHLSEKEEKRPNSWFTKLKDFTKSVIQVLGLKGCDATEEYVKDLRHLFA